MAKKLLIFAVIISGAFLAIQLFITTLLNQNARGGGVSSKVLSHNVEILQTICQKLLLTCVLIDEGILHAFALTEEIHRRRHAHDHRNCDLFCERRSALFHVNGAALLKSLNSFKIYSEKLDFKVFTVYGHDRRQESLEVRQGKDLLLYHVFLLRNQTIVQILATYSRRDHMWSAKLETVPVGLSHYAHLISPYSMSERILKPYKSVEVKADGVYLHVPQNLHKVLAELKTSKFIACDYNQARQFFSKHGYDSTEESERFRMRAKQILQIARIELDRLRIPYRLSSGTLLGWLRQCDFITYGKDVDMGIFIRDYNSSMIDAFQNAGLQLKHKFGRPSDSFELSFQYDDIKLDVFFFYEDKTSMWNGGTQVKSGRKFKYTFPKFSTCWSELCDMLVPVPCPPLPYVRANYGEKWATPVKEWDWKSSPPNVQPNGVWAPEERDDVIKTFL